MATKRAPGTSAAGAVHVPRGGHCLPQERPEHANGPCLGPPALRRKLGEDGSRAAYILSERGVGYRMPAPRDRGTDTAA